MSSAPDREPQQIETARPPVFTLVAPDAGADANVIAVWWGLRIVTAISVALWLNPRLADTVGLVGFESWVRHHAWIRWITAPFLAVMSFLSVCEVRGERSRPGRAESLAALDATARTSRRLDPVTGRLPVDAGYRAPVGAWSAELTRREDGPSRRSAACVRVRTRKPFGFLVRDAATEPGLMRGLQQQVMARAAARAAAEAVSEEARAAAAWLVMASQPPLDLTGIAHADRILARSDAPEVLRAALAEPSVAEPLERVLAHAGRWDWTFQPGATAGHAEMRLEFAAPLDDLAAVKALLALMEAALEHLARAGVVERG